MGWCLNDIQSEVVARLHEASLRSASRLGSVALAPSTTSSVLFKMKLNSAASRFSLGSPSIHVTGHCVRKFPSSRQSSGPRPAK